MAQSAKFVDITRSFLPIDPKAFPESLHGTSKEDSPENRIPVSAYEGKNFLPTPYGYKSYFGTNSKLDIDVIEGRVDHIFSYQNESLRNILVALCDNGIWIKEGTTSGAWIHLHVIDPGPDPLVHNEWTADVIANRVFCYQAGQPNYVRLDSSLVAPGIVATVVVPTFLNMEGQMGLFRAGGRLGFWDSAGSIGWSDLDTYADFEPSVETLAGNSIFQDVKGKIVTIKAHGKGFIIYATKSVVFVGPAITSLYQWEAASILNNAGISYSRQVAATVPDTVHFAYTTIGLFKIERAREELIIPEVVYYLKELKEPVYLKLLEGRFLCFEILSADYLNGLVQFTEGQTIPLTYTFPNASYYIPGISDGVLSGINVCATLAAHTAGANPGQQAAMPAPDKKPNSLAQPIYVAHLSNKGNIDPDNIVWGNTPCAVVTPDGVARAMNPMGVDTLSDYGTQATKTTVSGDDAYISGGWTMERFVAAQMAIWAAEEKNKAAFLSKIGNRAFVSAPVITTESSCAAVPTSRTECLGGRYAGSFTGPYFDYNPCSFWLTRYAATAFDLVTINAQQTACGPGVTTYSDASYGLTNSSLTALAAAVGSAFIVAQNAVVPVPGSNYNYALVNATIAGSNIQIDYTRNFFYGSPDPGGPHAASTNVGWTSAITYQKTITGSAHNELREVEIPPTPDTGWCELVGYRYTKADGSVVTVPVGDACANTNGDLGGTGRNATPQTWNQPKIANDGMLCSIPFEPVTVPGTPDVVYNWETPDLVLPAGTFLLQDGSPAPLYPDIQGSLVYDLQLKKWGKMVLPYKHLLDYSPMNDQSGRVISFETFGMLSGVLKSNGLIYMFDQYPADSYIRYGKIGYYRLGNTSAEEVRVHFRTPCTGTLSVETSLDGQMVAAGLEKVAAYTNALRADVTGCWPGAWQNVTIKGIFDINYLEYRGFIQGRR